VAMGADSRVCLGGARQNGLEVCTLKLATMPGLCQHLPLSCSARPALAPPFWPCFFSQHQAGLKASLCLRKTICAPAPL